MLSWCSSSGAAPVQCNIMSQSRTDSSLSPARFSVKLEDTKAVPRAVRELVFPIHIKQEPGTVTKRKFTAFTIENILADNLKPEAAEADEYNNTETDSRPHTPSPTPSPATSPATSPSAPRADTEEPRQSRARCPRTSFSDLQLMILERVFQIEPYPNTLVKQKLANRLQVPELTIVNWFKKRRTWWRKGDAKMIQNVARVNHQSSTPTPTPSHKLALESQESHARTKRMRTEEHVTPYSHYTETQMQQVCMSWSSLVTHPVYARSTSTSHDSLTRGKKYRTNTRPRKYLPYRY